MKKTKKLSSQRFVVSLFMLLSCSFQIAAQVQSGGIKDGLSIRLDVAGDDGILYDERTVLTFLEITNNTDESRSFEIEWEIATDDWRPLKKMSILSSVQAGTTLKSYCPLFEFPGPGFYRLNGTVITQTGDRYHTAKVIGIDPEKIMAPLDAMPDFNAFWESSLKELADVEPNFKLFPQQRNVDAKTKLFKVEMKSFGELTVRGWLEVPHKEGVYPALIRVPGYEGNMEPIDKFADLIVFSFNPRDHGESDNTGERGFDMWARGLEAKENYFYRGLYLDCIRAVDFLAARDDVDINRIAIWGGSQGGGLSFATAALDARIAFCIADIPFLCDWQKYFEITHWDEIDTWFSLHPEQNWQSMLRTLSYFDTKNMAMKIACPVVMGIGLQDEVCPPATSFATYNHIKSPKEYTIYKHEGHSQPESHYDDRFLRLRKVFGMD